MPGTRKVLAQAVQQTIFSVPGEVSVRRPAWAAPTPPLNATRDARSTPPEYSEVPRALPSGQNLADDSPRDVGQSEITARVAKRQPFVIQAELMQDRGVQVVHVDGP
jgi:hypothetical protein